MLYASWPGPLDIKKEKKNRIIHSWTREKNLTDNLFEIRAKYYKKWGSILKVCHISKQK